MAETVSAGKVEYEIGANKKGLDKGLSSAMGSIKGFIAKAAILGGVFKFFKMGVEQASDYAEAQDSLNRLIGQDGVKALEDFAKTSADTAGMSKADVLTMANNFAGLFQQIPAGAIKTGQALSDMEQRVADLGSQFNKSNEDINSGLQSALSGRISLTLQQMGIDLSQTAMQTRLASGEFTSMGYAADQSFQSLETGQQVLLRYQAFMDVTNKSAGNFADTLGISLPNQIKKMKSATKDAAASIGSVIIPILTKVINILGSLATWIGKNKALLGALAGAFAGFKLFGFLNQMRKAIMAFYAMAVAKAGAAGGIMGLVTAGVVGTGLAAILGGIAGGMFFSGGGSSGGSTPQVTTQNQTVVVNLTTNSDGGLEGATSNGAGLTAQSNLGKGTI